jgi:hypothetical protein
MFRHDLLHFLSISPQKDDPMAEDRVLLFADEEGFVRALAKRLAARELVVETAGDGESAIEKVERSDFDAILLDPAMSNMDAIETLRRPKEEINPDLHFTCGAIDRPWHGQGRRGDNEGWRPRLPGETSGVARTPGQDPGSDREADGACQETQEEVEDILRQRDW